LRRYIEDWQVLDIVLQHFKATCEPGRAVQVDPIKPTLKALETQFLKLKHDSLFSNFAFNFNMRRHSRG